VFFIPWRVVAENPARRILLLDLPGPAAPSISIF
jgi:DNA-directed RNA polymerase alpha subunit